MTYAIEKEFAFSAAHHLFGLPDDHQCARVHGHNYVVRVRLVAKKLDDVGFVLDYGDLKPFGKFLDRTLDHQDLNLIVDDNPTAENLAALLYEVLFRECAIPAHVEVAIGVSETPKTWAWYVP